MLFKDAVSASDYTIVGRGSVVGVATHYGSGIEIRWGQDFPHPSRQAPETTQPSIQWVPGLSRR
jgi:hypothetical protein